MATIVVGDVHGCLEELQDLMRQARPGPQDTVILVGDLVSKGPDSAGVVAWARETPGARCVLGNHELRYLEARRQGRRPAEKAYDAATIEQLGNAYESAVDYFETLPLFIETPEWVVLHAGFDPRRPLRGQSPEVVANIRRLEDGHTPWYELYEAPRLAVFGHWVRRQPLVRPNAVGLDTGCVYGNKLTALILPERRLLSVPARKEYVPRKSWQ